LAGRRVVVTDRSGNLWVYDTATAQPILTTRGTLAEFVDDDQLIVADGNAVRRVRVADGTSTTLHEHTGQIHALALDGKGGVWTGGADRDAWWSSVADERLGVPLPTEGRGFERGSRLGRVTAMAFVAERNVLLCSVCNSQLKIRYLDRGASASQPGDKFPDRFGGLIALDPAAQHAVCSDFGFGRITWIDLVSRDLAIAAESDVHTQAVTAVRFSPRGDLCLTASLDGTVQVWDAATRAIRSTLHLDGTTVQDACFTPDGEWIVTGDGRGQVRFWPLDPLAAARAHLRTSRPRR
jgi:WD40 repeat protein